jgi:hypothetical protein
MGRMGRKPLVVAVCTLAVLVGMVAFAAPAHAAAGAATHAAAVRAPNTSGGGCSYQTIPVQSCISMDGPYLVIDYYRNSWPSNCVQVSMYLWGDTGGFIGTWAFGCNQYHNVVYLSHWVYGECYQNETIMYTTAGRSNPAWSPCQIP